VRVRSEARAADDGYRCVLVPGLRAEVEAQRLADELAFASGRLRLLETDPPGTYGEAASEPDVEEACWLAFLTTYLSPLEGDDPFAAIREAHTAWSSGELPEALEGGPYSSHDPARGTETRRAYRRWAERAGSQEAAFTGDPGWSEERRFERIFERLALPGLGRRGRFDLLVTLGRLGRFPLRAPTLLLSENDATTGAAKRVFAIGDRLTLERRAKALCEQAGVSVEALDLALFNWVGGERAATLGAPPQCDDEAARAGTLAALGL
jgi:hypothetical protein